MAEDLIPIVMFISVAVVLGLVFYFKYRARHDMQATIRAAIKQGQELSPDIVDRLAQPRKGKDQDLRYAIMWLALAGATALTGIFVGRFAWEAFHGTMAGAAFPLCIGLAYLVMWKFTDRAQ